MKETKYKVVMVSAHGIKQDYCSDLTFDEAMDIGEANRWYFQDENGFVWDLEVDVDR